jgi:hypothetical protein
LSSLGALTVDDRSRWTRLAPFVLARRDIERVVNALQRAVPVPEHEIMVRGALRRQILGQSLPLASRRKNVENGVQDLADVHLASSAAAPGRRYRRRHQGPFRIRHITGITQPTARRSTAVFRLPHRAHLANDSGAKQGITTDSSDSTTSWIGSKRVERLKENSLALNNQPPPGYQLYSPDNSVHDDICCRMCKAVKWYDLVFYGFLLLFAFSFRCLAEG